MIERIDENEDIMEFPCRFPIKAIGEDNPDFRGHVVAIVAEYAGSIASQDIKSTPSKRGRYVSITVTFTATSRDQLDSIYQELTASEKIKLVF